MKNLIASAVIMTILIGGWLFFDSYSEGQLSDFSSSIIDEIIPDVEEEKWEEATKTLSVLSDRWRRYKQNALLFLDTDEISEIDYSLAKAGKYVKAEDISNASGELSSLAEQLRFIHEQQDISAANIL